ncbi:prephenate dehydrogenase [Williamsia sp. MIQD14]|uniref:prephenate dehydrogenase n=1 Tax=Williamsia sp. MIQD14 TaxID=3425703 RepID=UPI003DA0D8A4
MSADTPAHDTSPADPPATTGPVCVLGLGLIGGSLLRAVADSGRVAFGYNRSAATVSEATAAGHDADDDLERTLRRAAETGALIVVAVPVTALDPVLDAIARWAPNCAVTDVISVKQAVAQSMSRTGLSTRWVGGHPMAGTSQSGWAATDPTLFAGASWVVGADDGVDPDIWSAVADLALSVGAVVVPVASDEHDRVVAAISHLPHVTAAITAAVAGGDGRLALRLAAGSFRDGTRVAGTAVPLQRAMLEANTTALLGAMDEALDRLTRARDDLRDNGSVEVVVDDGHRVRTRWEAMTSTTAPPITGVSIGATGWAAELRRQAHLGRVWTNESRTQIRSASPS